MGWSHPEEKPQQSNDVGKAHLAIGLPIEQRTIALGLWRAVAAGKAERAVSKENRQGTHSVRETEDAVLIAIPGNPATLFAFVRNAVSVAVCTDASCSVEEDRHIVGKNIRRRQVGNSIAVEVRRSNEDRVVSHTDPLRTPNVPSLLPANTETSGGALKPTRRPDPFGEAALFLAAPPKDDDPPATASRARA